MPFGIFSCIKICLLIASEKTQNHVIWLVGYGSTSHVTGAHRFKLFKVRKNAKIRNRFSQVPYLTQDTIWESDKNTTTRHIQESQENDPFPAGDPNTARHRQDNMAKTNTNKKKIHE